MTTFSTVLDVLILTLTVTTISNVLNSHVVFLRSRPKQEESMTNPDGEILSDSTVRENRGNKLYELIDR